MRALAANAVLYDVALTAYIVAMAAALGHLVRRRESLWRFAMIATQIGWILHTLAIAVRGVELGRLPILTPSELVSVVIWVAVLLEMWAERQYGMRALGANFAHTRHGVFTNRPETLTNDYFVNLLDMNTKWQKSEKQEGVLEGRSRKTSELKWKATVVDLVFGSNSQLRAAAEVYGSCDAGAKFAQDFAAAWTKVMNLDRFDLK